MNPISIRDSVAVADLKGDLTADQSLRMIKIATLPPSHVRGLVLDLTAYTGNHEALAPAIAAWDGAKKPVLVLNNTEKAFKTDGKTTFRAVDFEQALATIKSKALAR